MSNDFQSFARGDVAALIEVLGFLTSSVGHSIQSVDLDSLHPKTAQTLRQSVAEDGVDPESDLGESVAVLHMVFGRVERDVIIAHVAGGGLNSTQYVVERSKLLGRLYRRSRPEVVFLEHEIRTGDSNPVFLTGSTEYLGNWDTARVLPLEPRGFGPGGHHWSVLIPVRSGQRIEFKFLKKKVVWEAGDNRVFTAGDQNASTSDNFREA